MRAYDILNMLEGRDLDVLIAEKVMGLKVVARDHPCGYDYECGEYMASHFIPATEMYKYPDAVYLPEKGTYPPEPTDYDDRKYCYVFPVPFYSKYIWASWRVAEKLGCFFIDSTAPKLGIDVAFFLNDSRYKATADTVQLAICRAALLYAMRDNLEEQMFINDEDEQIDDSFTWTLD